MLKVALDSFSLAHEAWVRMARARVFKRKEKNNNKHGGETFIASRVLLTAIFFVPNKEWRAKRTTNTAKWVISPTWGPPPTCKQALKLTYDDKLIYFIVTFFFSQMDVSACRKREKAKRYHAPLLSHGLFT